MVCTSRGQRIRIARKAMGLSQTELAIKAGKNNHQIIHTYEKDKRGVENPDIDLLLRISDVCDVSIEWLLTGNENKKFAETCLAIKTLVPVIEWNEISAWKKVRNGMSASKKEIVPVFHENTDCFGLKVKDDSMVADGNEDCFKEGDIVIVDPYLSPNIGDYVISTASENDDPLLRKFILINSVTFLSPLNEKYPIHLVTDKTNFYGVVIGQHRQFFNKK